MAVIAVKVVPRAARDELAGWLDGVLKVRVRAVPEKGRANDAVVRMLAETLGVPRRSVRVVAGHTSTRKTVEVEGLAADALEQILERAVASE